MIEIIQGWSKESQGLLAFGILATFTVVALGGLFMLCTVIEEAISAITIVVRGYNPNSSPPRKKQQDCHHRDRLQESCVMKGDNCATQAECDVEIAKRKQLPIIKDPAPLGEDKP